jgi:hypothetical protein
LIMAIHPDSDRLREFLHAKIGERKNQIHPAHNPRFNLVWLLPWSS